MMRYWYEGFVGLRYLRASPKRGSVSLIAGIAITGLALGVAVLIVVLSVMNGFQKELRTRILGVASHIQITGSGGELPQWQEAAREVARHPEV
ncbi:MAG TPA: lipoprotein-releasing system transmembrane subunit LolC, partial [Steroidobacteraceae bacterium]|nr:lipoprotein-releasing system transmembrane subunit LolC [Steroidobacteraceae bacterium]